MTQRDATRSSVHGHSPHTRGGIAPEDPRVLKAQGVTPHPARVLVKIPDQAEVSACLKVIA